MEKSSKSFSKTAPSSSTSIDKDLNRVQAIHTNNEISKFASRKDLGSALALYEEALKGGYANTHTFCSVINAYVRCGSVAGAVSVMAEMRARRFKPDIVSFTTIMKGYCNDSDITKAYSLFRDMELAQPKVIPNIRTVNTFLRGCVSMGELLLAEKIFLQCKEWSVVADISTFEYLSQMYSQSLNLDKVLPLLGRIAKEPSNAIGLASISVSVARTKALLGDWKGSRKSISAAIEFIKMDELYDGSADTSTDATTTAAPASGGGQEEMDVDKKPAASGGKRAWHTKDDSDNTRKESLERFRVHRQNELRHDISLLEAFINASSPPSSGSSSTDSQGSVLKSLKAVIPMVARTLCFFKLTKPAAEGKNKKKKGDKPKAPAAALAPVEISRDECDADIIARLEAHMAAEAAAEEEKAEAARQAEIERISSIKQNIVDTFSGRLGLSTLLKQLEKLTGSTPQITTKVISLLDSIVASSLSSTGYFDFNKFDSAILNDFVPNAMALYQGSSTSNATTSSPETASNSKTNKLSKAEAKPVTSDRPIKLEICSGAGEWAVAQAESDRQNHWMTLELRFDRAYQTLSRAIYANLDNMTVLCGDANEVIKNNILDNSIQQIFINHPEPPQQTGHNLESQGRHLLTKKFFNEVFRILKEDGTLTIVTDNQWYAKYLLRQFSTTTYPRVFQSVDLSSTSHNNEKGWTRIDSEGGVHLYEGRPGSACGHIVDASSYFDRLWKVEKITERYFFFLRKHPVSSGEMGPQGSIKPKTVNKAHNDKPSYSSKHTSNTDNSGAASKKRPFPNDSKSNDTASRSMPVVAAIPPPAVKEPEVLNIRGRFKGTALTVDATEAKSKKIKFSEDD